MTKLVSLFLALSFLFCGSVSFSQQNKIDSLRLELKKQKKDTSQVSLFMQLGLELRSSHPDSSNFYFVKALKLAESKKLKIQQQEILNEQAYNLYRKNEVTASLEKLQKVHRTLMKLRDEVSGSREERRINKILIANYNYQGTCYRKDGEFQVAIQQFEVGLELAEKINYYEGQSSLLNNLAQTFYMQGRYPESLTYCMRGIKLNEDNHNQQGVASSTGNAGIIFKEMGEYEKAVTYFKKALALNEELGNKRSIAVNLGNIGVGYGHLNQPEKAIEYYERAIKIHEEMNESQGLQYNYGNIAIEYSKLKQFDRAMAYFEKSLKALEKEPDDYVATFTYNSIATTYLQMKDYKNAKLYLDKAKVLAEGMGAMDQMKDNYEAQADLYTALNQPQKALDYYRLFVKYRDSIRSEESIRNTLALDYKHRMESDSLINAEKEKANEAELEKKNALLDKNDIELNAQQNYLYFAFGGIALVLFFAFFMYNRYKISQKQNAIIQKQKLQAEIQKKDIEFQKSLVDTKQQEIIDSINYAQRIQQAILATPDEIKKHIPDSFLLYKPKDIVAGDFYFFEVTDTHIFIAAADCTGHGVPGALISVVCSNALTRCVKEFRLTDPGEILDKTRELVLETLLKSGSDMKDGMDISFCAYEKSGGVLKWAGANNPLWYLEENTIYDITADKQAIGQNYHPKPYTSHHLKVKKGSWLFLFTDGYADQFGGPEGKKFKYSQLKNLLTESCAQGPEKIKSRLSQVFEDWRGDLEQVDDVCIIGVRI